MEAIRKEEDSSTGIGQQDDLVVFGQDTALYDLMPPSSSVGGTSGGGGQKRRRKPAATVLQTRQYSVAHHGDEEEEKENYSYMSIGRDSSQKEEEGDVLQNKEASGASNWRSKWD